MESKLINIDWLISKIDSELSQSRCSVYKCTDGTDIRTDVGYVADWWREYKHHILPQDSDNSTWSTDPWNNYDKQGVKGDNNVLE